MKKILEFLRKILKKGNSLFFVGSSDKLPEPLSKEEETLYVTLSMDGDAKARAKLIDVNRFDNPHLQ